MEITPDPSICQFEDQGLFHEIVGFHHLHNLYFLQIWEFYLYIGLTPFLYLHITTALWIFQDGIFHKNGEITLEKLRMDRKRKL